MTRDSKARLLLAYDALVHISMALPVTPPADPRAAPETQRTGAEARCDLCGELSWRKEHDQSCAVGRALAALRFNVPTFLERERWLAEAPSPQR